MDPLAMGLMYGGGALLGGIGGMLGANKQAGAAQQAGNQSALWQMLGIQNAQNMYNQAASTLSPYTGAGSKSVGLLMDYLQGTGAQQAGVGGGGANLLSTFQPTQQQLEQTPGYQWAKQQTLGAMTNSGAARGLGASGNLVQGIGQAATGLASQTFQQQLQNYMNQNQQAYNMLMGPSQLGATAANTLASGGMQLGQSMMNAYGGVGNTLGAATMGAGNALSGGIQSLTGGAGSAMMMPYMAQMYSGQGATNYGMGSPAFQNAANWANAPQSISNAITGGQNEYFQYNQ